MKSFEERLTLALRAAADRAPEPEVLHPMKRGSHRWGSVLLAAAAAVLAVAVPVGLVTLVGGESQTPPTSTRGDWRVESWHGVTLRVPAYWTHGSLFSCGHEPTPVVDRPSFLPGAMTLPRSKGREPVRVSAGLCVSATWNNGVLFEDASDGQPAQVPRPTDKGAAVRVVTEGDVRVYIVVPGEDLAEEIAASVRQFRGTDPNGCPATVTLPDPKAVPYSAANGDPAVLCAYEMPRRGIGTAVLEASDRLDPEDASRFAQALEAAPLGGGPPSSLDSCWASEVSVAIAYNEARTWIYLGCRPLGVGQGDEARRLTSKVLYWALIPGWNSFVDPAAPMPSELRVY